jgi:hypothetical protein
VKANAVHVLVALAVASPLLALLPLGQDPATDWPKEVERACTSPRYGLRLAAARKVAKGGAGAVPAIVAWSDKNGRNALPQALVDAIADESTTEAPVLDLLTAWAADRDFYWRASALRGLTLRTGPAGYRRVEILKLCKAHADDPAWLMRTHARLGLALGGDDGALALPESDPRARARLPLLLLQQGKLPPLQPLLDALGDERTFQETPWGQQTANEAHKALKAWLGDDHPLAKGGAFADTAQGLAAMHAAVAKKSGQALTLPQVVRDRDVALAGGVELLSCKHGDQFVQWTDDGRVFLGVDAARELAVPAAAWDGVSKDRTALRLPDAMGVVVCDSIRLRWAAPKTHGKAAPASLPADATNWLKRLAQAIEDTGDAKAAAELRAGIEQFASR